MPPAHPATNHTIDALHTACGGDRARGRPEIPFSSEHKWSALILGGDLSGSYIFGAPEMLLPHLRPGTNIEATVDEWTHRGLRVLLFASAPANSPLATESEHPTLPDWLDLLGADQLSRRTAGRGTIDDPGLRSTRHSHEDNLGR